MRTKQLADDFSVIVPTVVAVALLGLAMVNEWGREFYTILRIVVTFAALVRLARSLDALVCITNKGMRATHGFLKCAFIVAAILYNPLIPVYLQSRELWTVVNGVTIVLFFVSLAVFFPFNVDRSP